MRLKFVLVAVGTMAILACSSSGDQRREEYLDADYYTRLELPPDLTQPPSSQQLSVPKPTDTALEKFKSDTQNLGKPGPATRDDATRASAPAIVLPALKGVELKFDTGVFWLEVDTSAQKLWPQLDAFWSHEGIPLVQRETALGLIETDWVSKLQHQPDASWLTRVFSNVEPDRLDKFRMRLVPAGAKTRVYVSHSGMEVMVQGDDVNWRARCSEAGLEQEILNRLGLFLGLDAAQANTVLAGYQPYASRVKLPADEATSIYLKEGLASAWQRTQRALDRLGADIQEADSNRHQFKIALTRLKPEAVNEERDELAESSWLMQWLTGAGDKAEGDKARQFRIALVQEKSQVKLSILTLKGVVAEGPLAEQLRTKLARELQ